MEARRINGERAGNAEIISGIRNINDPNNFFSGLARINRDLNKSGARYIINQNGQIQINGLYTVDPLEFASVSRNERIGVLSSLPPRQLTATMSPEIFNARNNFISDNMLGRLTNMSLLLGITETASITGGNVSESITALLQDFSEENILQLMEVFPNFINSLSHELINTARQLHPLVSIVVICLQFLLHFIQNTADVLGIDFERTLTIINDDNYLTRLVQEFTGWLRQRTEGDARWLKNGDEIIKKCLLQALRYLGEGKYSRCCAVSATGVIIYQLIESKYKIIMATLFSHNI